MCTRAVTALLALCLAVSARAAPLYQRPINADCIQTGVDSETVSLYPTEYQVVGDQRFDDDVKTEITNAVGFTVDYYPTYKVVNNTIAGEVYVLSQCGVDQPPADQFPEGTKFFTVPLTSLSAPETVPYAFVEYLGLGDRVHDISPYVVSPCGQALLGCPNRDAASPGFEELSNATLLEETVGGSIDGMLVSALSDFPKSFALSAAQDPGALNRAEWIKFVGLFFNKEREASNIFDGIKAEYDATKAAAVKAAGTNKPVVAWAQFFSYPGLGTSYQLSFDPYQQQLTEDAGAAMLDRAALVAVDGVQSTDPPTLTYTWDVPGAFASQEEARAAFLAALEKADVIIDETYSATPTTYTPAEFLATYNLTAEEAAGVPAWADQQVYREDGLLSYDEPNQIYGLDWFEGAIARPGQVLKDIVRAAQPEAAQGQNFTWIRNLFTEEPVIVGAQDCKAAAPCSAEPATICPFVKLCAAGQAPAILLESSADGESNTCTYAECGQASALAPSTAAPAPIPTTNAAAMAAPAIVLTLAVVAFVEVLMHFC